MAKKAVNHDLSDLVATLKFLAVEGEKWLQTAQRTGAAPALPIATTVRTRINLAKAKDVSVHDSVVATHEDEGILLPPVTQGEPAVPLLCVRWDLDDQRTLRLYLFEKSPDGTPRATCVHFDDKNGEGSGFAFVHAQLAQRHTGKYETWLGKTSPVHGELPRIRVPHCGTPTQLLFELLRSLYGSNQVYSWKRELTSLIRGEDRKTFFRPDSA